MVRRPVRATSWRFDKGHSAVMVFKIVDGVEPKVRLHKYLFYFPSVVVLLSKHITEVTETYLSLYYSCIITL